MIWDAYERVCARACACVQTFVLHAHAFVKYVPVLPFASTSFLVLGIAPRMSDPPPDPVCVYRCE